MAVKRKCIECHQGRIGGKNAAKLTRALQKQWHNNGGRMINFLRDFWKLLNDYKFRGYDFNGKELFAIPLSWLFVILLLCLS